MKIFCRIIFCIVMVSSPWRLLAQIDPPNDANSIAQTGIAGAAGRLAATPTNIYTGLPAISLPLYSYSHHNGLVLGISLDYLSGGVQDNQSATPEGLGWMINAGGLITRTVRGMPDDVSSKGFLYNGALPSNYQPYGFQYYHDSLDAEQDVFQFNFNGRSGKFFIGKNGQIATVPLSKLKISYAIQSGGTQINTFYVTTEDGVKYVFNDKEYEADSLIYYKSGYNNQIYVTSWYLSQMIAPFGTDTIYFKYNSIVENFRAQYPQTAYVKVGDSVSSQSYMPTGTNICTKLKIASIIFPDQKNITFLYDRNAPRFDGTDSVLNRIKINDSIFRYGYIFDWSNIFGHDTIVNDRSLLHGLIKYTPYAMKTLYRFTYNSPWLPAPGTPGDTLQNGRDYWGFYNGNMDNFSAIPRLPGMAFGANRSPVNGKTQASSLLSITDSLSGGITSYIMEPNDIPQYNTSRQVDSINAKVSANSGITLAQTGGNLFTMNIAVNNGFNRTGTSPFSSGCSLVVSIKDSLGSTTYASSTIAMSQLFYVGTASFTFSLPNGNYRLVTSATGCTDTVTNFPVNITWQNQTLIGSAVPTGGLRLKYLLHYDPVTGRTDTVSSYRYITTGGQSSGFLGATPVYSYPYSQTVNNGSTTVTNFTAISSDPLNNLNYSQGSPVGYSRVVVYKGTPTHNLGNTVYEFTGLQDAGFSEVSATFPYAPTTQPDWAMGLPKRTSIYDSSGHLIMVTHKTYSNSSVAYNNSNFQSLKLGKVSTTYYGDPTLLSTPYTEYYTGALYYPQSGISELVSSIDTIYHPNGSMQTAETDYQYDTNYNLIQVTTPYDPTRGLTMQKNFYYPYNYTILGAIGKLRDSGNLSQVISSESWITGDGNPRMVGDQITDFQSLTTKHVKPLAIYDLQTNAPVPQSVIGGFNPAVLVRDTTRLIAQQRFVRYDNLGNLLETQSALTGASNSVILDYGNQFPVARVSNANSSSIAYSSFESDGWGGWTPVYGYSILLPAGGGVTGKRTFSGTITKKIPAGSYLLTLWSDPTQNVYANGSSGTLISTTGPNGWRLYQWNLSSSDSLTVSVTGGNIDEVRLYPINANMVTSTFEPMIGLTCNADANNTITYLQYDKLYRTKFIRDKNQNILKRYDYDDRDSVITVNPIWVQQGTTYTCETPNNGNMDRTEMDVNFFSESYLTSRKVFDHKDCTSCPFTCTSPQNKLISCVCQAGERINTSSVYTKVNGTTWMWVCTYHYYYPDGTTSSDYTENDTSSCPMGCVGDNCPVVGGPQ